MAIEATSKGRADIGEKVFTSFGTSVWGDEGRGLNARCRPNRLRLVEG